MPVTIGALRERVPGETRVSLVPEIADKFTAAAPFNFLVASLIVLIFGAGQICVDRVVTYLIEVRGAKQSQRSIAV